MTKEELIQRDQRSQNLQVFQINDRDYFVESSKGKITYKVIVNNGHKICTCGDYAHNIGSNPEFVCKHILAVLNANGNAHTLTTMKHKPKLDDRWITSIKGKDFVVYSGLLDLSHQIGLKSITVEVEQFPDKDNGNEAICRATTHSNDGQVFVDYGDANPKNTSSMVVNHLLRVASTRAKARTLRDMTNIGMTCLEELGGDDDIAAAPPVRVKTTKPQAAKQAEQPAKPQAAKPVEQPKQAAKPVETPAASPKAEKPEPSNGNGRPSSAQVNAIKNLAYRRGLTDENMNTLAKERLNIPSFQDLSAEQAATFIKILQQSA
jgi:cell division septation protein DedD